MEGGSLVYHLDFIKHILESIFIINKDLQINCQQLFFL